MVVGIGTRCVLFTDLVRSTELRVQLGEDRADDFHRRHETLLAEAIAAHGGVVVKYLGDGALATFESAADGVAAAIAVQQAVTSHATRHPEKAFEERIGLSIGDVSVERDDVHGTAVIEAARLCATASGGEILVADIVRALARGRGGFVFESVGELELKGLPDPVPACAVRWTPAEEASGDVPLPPLLVNAGAIGYVGREDVLARLDERWSAVRGGGSAAVLISGEPGIGKTRTSEEIARRAHRDGALVLYGRCEEGLNLPYQPFLEALDHYVRYVPGPVLGRLPGELVRLLPDLAERVPALPVAVDSDPRTEEHRLLTAIASWLAEASRGSGLVLVLDDLHWATRPTLLMLTHTIREAEAADDARLLVVATFRDSDLDPDHPFSETLAELARLQAVERIGLQGLNDAEVAGFLQAAAGHDLGEDGLLLARLLHTETEGNPFFVGEVLRHLIETGAVRRDRDRWVVPDVQSLAVPEGVRDVIMRRLSRLGDETRQVLTVAAVIGRDIDVDVLCAVADHGEDVVIDALDDALRARLVEETGPDHYRFSHALVRMTLYDQFSATRRRRMHRRTAAALEKLHPDDVTALAHHFVEGGPDHGDTAPAVRYTLAAAAQSLAARALAEAEGRFRSALELLDEDDHASPSDRLDALIGLGICLRDQSRAEFREVLLEASARAHVLGDTAREVSAVLANSRGITSVIGGTDPERVAAVQAVLESLGPEPRPERVRLLARLAAELVTSGPAPEGIDLGAEALALAEQLGEPGLVEEVVSLCGQAFFATSDPATLPELIGRAVARADERDDPGGRVWTRLLLAAAYWTLFDFTRDREVRAQALAIANADRVPGLLWSALAFFVPTLMSVGRLDEAEQLAHRGLAMGQAAGEPDADSWWGAAMAALETFRNGAGDLADLAGPMADEYPGAIGWRTFQIMALTHAGRLDEARAVLDAQDFDFGILCRTMWQTGPAVQLAEVAYQLGDADLAAKVLPGLLEHAGEFAHVWIAAIGSVDWALASVHLVLDDVEAAVDWATRAVTACDRAGAPLFASQARVRLVEALARRAGPGDLDLARQQRRRGLEFADGCGARFLAEQLRAVELPELSAG